MGTRSHLPPLARALATPASFQGIRHDAYDVGSLDRRITGRGALGRRILEWGQESVGKLWDTWRPRGKFDSRGQLGGAFFPVFVMNLVGFFSVLLHNLVRQ